MKIRKYKKLRLKWIMGRNMTQKEIKDLQSVYPEPEWKNKIKASANPEYKTAWSPRTLRARFISHYSLQAALAKFQNNIYYEWLKEQVKNGSIKEMPKKLKWK